jgi:hypothetical protein
LTGILFNRTVARPALLAYSIDLVQQRQVLNRIHFIAHVFPFEMPRSKNPQDFRPQADLSEVPVLCNGFHSARVRGNISYRQTIRPATSKSGRNFRLP